MHFYAGRYKIADSLFRRVLEMHRQLYGGRHPLVADDLINLGAVQQDLGYYAEAERLNRQALELNRSYYGEEPSSDGAQPDHPRPGARFAEIYRAVYHNRHYLIGIALSNLAGVYVERKQYVRAEQLYRDALQVFAETLPPGHLNTAIAQIKLGRALVRERRYSEAEGHILAGYGILTKQTNPSVSYLQSARKELVTVYDALHRPEQAKKFQSELTAADTTLRRR